jgi:hypothetical protein
MPRLDEVVPDFDLLVSMKPHELAPVLLRLARDHLQNGMFTLDSVGKAYSGGRSAYAAGQDVFLAKIARCASTDVMHPSVRLV